VVLLGLRQDEVTTSADFDWKLLHRLYAEHVLDDHGAPQDDRLWQTTPPKPTDPIDRANWQSIVAAGAPTWLGKGWQATPPCAGRSIISSSPARDRHRSPLALADLIAHDPCVGGVSRST
jgi:hypothetical protein